MWKQSMNVARISIRKRGVTVDVTWVRCHLLDALAMGSVTWVHAAPNSITLCGPMCIMSKKAFTPTAALHCNRKQALRQAFLVGLHFRPEGLRIAQRSTFSYSIYVNAQSSESYLFGYFTYRVIKYPEILRFNYSSKRCKECRLLGCDAVWLL
jgi:hypothetical protein